MQKARQATLQTYIAMIYAAAEDHFWRLKRIVVREMDVQKKYAIFVYGARRSNDLSERKTGNFFAANSNYKTVQIIHITIDIFLTVATHSNKLSPFGAALLDDQNQKNSKLSITKVLLLEKH